MATPKSQKSGVTFRGISWNGGERAPLLPQTPPPFRARWTGPSVQALHDFLEHVAAMLEVVEHVERGAGRREQHDAAGRRHRARAVDRLLERLGDAHRDRRVADPAPDLPSLLPAAHHLLPPPSPPLA